MEETNVPNPPGEPDSQGASGSRDPAGPPPIPPELGQTPPAPVGSASVADGTGGRKLADWLAFLRNRLILGGLAVLVVLLLIAIVLVLVGDGDAEPGRRLAAGEPTRESEATASPRRGLVGHVRTTVPMRNGPDLTYAVLGTIPRGTTVSVVGRNDDDSWLQVIYPPGSELRGWVDATFIEMTGDVSQLAIAGPGAGPSVPVPTSAVPVQVEPIVPSPTAEGPASPTATQPQFPSATPAVLPTATASPQPKATPVPTRMPQPTPTPPPLPTDTPAA